MNLNPALPLLALLGACVTPLSATIAPAGSPVALDQAVRVGPLVATPIGVKEDSRCPINARCIWAGRLVVSTRIDGPGWHETAPLTLGTPYATHGTAIQLSSGEPGRTTQAPTAPRSYRFTYELAD